MKASITAYQKFMHSYSTVGFAQVFVVYFTASHRIDRLDFTSLQTSRTKALIQYFKLIYFI